MRLIYIIRIFLIALLTTGIYGIAVSDETVNPPNIPSVDIKHYARINSPLLREVSGIVKSRSHRGIFWVHNDSGNEASIFPITLRGEVIAPKGAGVPCQGIAIQSAVNTDWEDIAADDSGSLIIGDFGNNENERHDLALYIIEEPNPREDSAVPVTKKIPFHYPEQKSFPAEPRSFDCEAVFYATGKIYILTKHRDDAYTSLYRFDTLDTARSNPVTLVDKFDIGGRVSAADIAPDGKKLAVLTRNAVWLFETVGAPEDFFRGSIRWLPVKAGKCEGICFDGNELMIVNEKGKLFRLPLGKLIKIK